MIENYLNYQPVLGEKAWVHERAVVIGRVTLGNDVSVWPCAVLRGDVNDIIIGNRSNVQDGVIVHVTHSSDHNPKGYSTTVGEDVTIGHNAVLHGCTIGNRVLVGMGATILDGAIVPDEVMIGACALVPMNKTLESGYLYLGSPAKAVRELTSDEKIFLGYSPSHYAELKENYKYDN